METGNALVDLKKRQMDSLDAAYKAASTSNITYNGSSFQADAQSERLLQSAVIVYTAEGAVPNGFFWQAADNTAVSVKLSDLQTLLAEIVARRWNNFQHLQTLKGKVEDANTLEDVTAVQWTAP